VDEVADLVRLFGRLTAARIRAQLQYRASFALQTAGMFLISFLDFVAVLVIFTNVPQLGGWSLPEVALLYAVSSLAFALTDLVIGHLDQLPQLVRDGTFDLLLIRPRGTLFQVVTQDFQLRRLGKVAQAAIVLVVALTVLPIDWTPGRVAVLIAAIPAGVLIFASIWIAAICIVFWTVDGNEAANAVTYGGNYLTQYPINIYDQWLRRLLAYVVPTAFIAYFPMLYVLGKPDPLGLPVWLELTSPLVAVVAAIGSAAIWRGAVRHYQSAGG
jgi:viologen exporter family transport system permease protein